MAVEQYGDELIVVESSEDEKEEMEYGVEGDDCEMRSEDAREGAGADKSADMEEGAPEESKMTVVDLT